MPSAACSSSATLIRASAYPSHQGINTLEAFFLRPTLGIDTFRRTTSGATSIGGRNKQEQLTFHFWPPAVSGLRFESPRTALLSSLTSPPSHPSAASGSFVHAALSTHPTRSVSAAWSWLTSSPIAAEASFRPPRRDWRCLPQAACSQKGLLGRRPLPPISEHRMLV